MEGIFVNGQQLKFLKEMSTWLSKESWTSEAEKEIAIKVRNLISKIEKKGFYSENEAELLNLMREQYIKNKKKR